MSVLNRNINQIAIDVPLTDFSKINTNSTTVDIIIPASSKIIFITLIFKILLKTPFFLIAS